MAQSGRHAGAFGLEAHGFRKLKAAQWNLPPAALVEHALARREGLLAKDGPLVVLTGEHTGRSVQTSSSSRTPRLRTASGGTTTRR